MILLVCYPLKKLRNAVGLWFTQKVFDKRSLAHQVFLSRNKQAKRLQHYIIFKSLQIAQVQCFFWCTKQEEYHHARGVEKFGEEAMSQLLTECVIWRYGCKSIDLCKLLARVAIDNFCSSLLLVNHSDYYCRASSNTVLNTSVIWNSSSNVTW